MADEIRTTFRTILDDVQTYLAHAGDAGQPVRSIEDARAALLGLDRRQLQRHPPPALIARLMERLPERLPGGVAAPMFWPAASNHRATSRDPSPSSRSRPVARAPREPDLKPRLELVDLDPDGRPELPTAVQVYEQVKRQQAQRDADRRQPTPKLVIEERDDL